MGHIPLRIVARVWLRELCADHRCSHHRVSVRPFADLSGAPFHETNVFKIAFSPGCNYRMPAVANLRLYFFSLAALNHC